MFSNGPSVEQVCMKEINAKLLHHQTVKGGHAMKTAGTFPCASYKMLGAKGREMWFVAVVEHWFAEHLRLRGVHPDWSTSKCMSEAARSAEELDARIKTEIQSTYAHRDGSQDAVAST